MSLNLSNSSAKNSKIQPDNEFGNFDFGLDEAQEQRALRLHCNSIVIDMVQQGIGGYRVFDEPHLKALEKSSKDYMSLDAIYAEDIAGRSDIMRGRWDASGITVGGVGDVISFVPLVERLSWLTIATTSTDIHTAKSILNL